MYLCAKGLTAKPSKCQFGMKDCGHVVRSGEVHPEVNKVDAVQSFAIPKTKRQVREFLGITRITGSLSWSMLLWL